LEKHGVNSVNYASASKFLIDTVVPSIIEQPNKVYENRVFSKVYSLGRSDRYKNQVYDVLKKYFNVDELKDYYPNIYLPSDALTAEKKISICNSLKSIDEQLVVDCDTQNHFMIAGRTVLSIDSIYQTPNASGNTTTLETSLEIMDWQVFIWMVFLFLFCVVFAIVSVNAIDYSQDFLLYAFDEKAKKMK